MINIYDYKIAHPDTFKQLSVKDLLFVYYRCPQVDKQMQLYTHYNLISFTLGGSRILHLADKTYTVDKNSVYFTRKTAYVQELPESPGWELLALYIPDSFLTRVVDEYRDYLPIKKVPPATSEVLIKIHLNDSIRTYFYSLIPYFTQKIPPSEKLLELKFKELILNILSSPFNKELLAYILRLKENDRIPIWQVMEKNYMYNLTIGELAQISGRSVTTFKRDFFAYYKSTPGKWLTEKRLQRAEKLLNTSKLSISEIAFNSGFENMSHFSRIFKEKYNHSPLQYRKKQFEIA